MHRWSLCGVKIGNQIDALRMFTIVQREEAKCFCLELLRNAFGRPVVHRTIEKPCQAEALTDAHAASPFFST